MCLYLTAQKTEAVERDSSHVLTVAAFQVTKYAMVPMTVVTTLMNLTAKVNDTYFQGDFRILLCKYLVCK